ncbi:hypothetical protein D3875_21265 [Deinococcus cavernae]|uniref:Uncharacterized protein n=1 Tax=Deinococcus cavernae TaxID=2320857 RepID=A0A418UZL3_9DEIO|nr:hypothetical protein [Deinococcus cavernae]RJF68888.1 hypothetical protein D3875_21265 [Deinococcus cavernae]
MSEADLQPLLVLHVPAGHEIDPQALGELTGYVGERYGAAILINKRTLPGGPTSPVLLGRWPPANPTDVLIDLAPRVGRVFFNLDWLEKSL